MNTKIFIIIIVSIFCFLSSFVEADITAVTELSIVAGDSFSITYTLNYHDVGPKVCYVNVSIIPNGTVFPDDTGFNLTYNETITLHHGDNYMTIFVNTSYCLKPENYSFIAYFQTEESAENPPGSSPPIIITQTQTRIINHTIYVNAFQPENNTEIIYKNNTLYQNQTLYQNNTLFKGNLQNEIIFSIASCAIGVIVTVALYYPIYRRR